jgi:hypothetical protein
MLKFESEKVGLVKFEELQKSFSFFSIFMYFRRIFGCLENILLFLNTFSKSSKHVCSFEVLRSYFLSLFAKITASHLERFSGFWYFGTTSRFFGISRVPSVATQKVSSYLRHTRSDEIVFLCQFVYLVWIAPEIAGCCLPIIEKFCQMSSLQIWSLGLAHVG